MNLNELIILRNILDRVVLTEEEESVRKSLERFIKFKKLTLQWPKTDINGNEIFGDY